MYSLNQILTGIRNPDILRRELNRLYYRRLYTWEYNRDGIDVFAADWDNILILDACRYDLFKDENTLPGSLESRQSRGSSTVEFLKANFGHRELNDVVYVTANPQLYRHDSISPSLHATVNIWDENGWNDDYRTVMPETVTEYARRAADEYPNKRLVVHYIQPHYPFIGPTGKKHFNLDSLAFWKQVRDGKVSVSKDVISEAYRENLQLALPYVKELIERLEGKTVVTSDHGQALGERSGPTLSRCFGHPAGIYTDELVEVPWLIHETGQRKDIVAAESENEVNVDNSVVKDRLKELGYAD
ncbi:hypothetical protein [Haloarcula litorea]|uniref:hypothetical protein n=1 Tax=Haloarcula litorea TaxID=3032579 RepID=UPI0023E84B1D|nr:hypothetical protein [Halomicroarcula sp. GDY20]